MSTRLLLLLCLVCVPLAAHAQALAPPLLPPPPPPAWIPPSDYVIQAHELEVAGRRKKHVGIALMASGSALALAGTGLAIAGVWHGNNQCHGGYYSGSNHDRSYYDGDCGDHALTTAGVTTSLIGVGVLVPGIIEHVSGGKLVESARRLRQCGGLCW